MTKQHFQITIQMQHGPLRQLDNRHDNRLDYHLPTSCEWLGAVIPVCTFYKKQGLLTRKNVFLATRKRKYKTKQKTTENKKPQHYHVTQTKKNNKKSFLVTQFGHVLFLLLTFSYISSIFLKLSSILFLLFLKYLKSQ